VSTPLIITVICAGTEAVLVLAGIAAWRSVAGKRIAAGGTHTWALLNHRMVIPPPAADAPAPLADEQQGGVLGFARNEDAA
jgi:hypothetical protein